MIGPAFCAAIDNGIMLGYLMYRGQIVPRPWAIPRGGGRHDRAGIAGAATLRRIRKPVGGLGRSDHPRVVWELFLRIYLTFKGFTPSPFLEREPARAPTP